MQIEKIHRETLKEMSWVGSMVEAHRPKTSRLTAVNVSTA